MVDIRWQVIDNNSLYLLCVWLARRIFSYSSHIYLLGEENLPPTGAFLLVSNHISHFDPPLLSCAIPRQIEWLAMEELFKGRIGKKFFSSLGTIPVDRSQPDSNALRKMLDRLKQGAVIGIFPEGGIRSGQNSLLAGAMGKSGFTTLSLLSGVPIIPCIILGSDRLYETKYWNPLSPPLINKRAFFTKPRAPIWVAFGKPIQSASSSSLVSRREARNQIHAQVVVSLQSLTQALKDHFQLLSEDFPQTAQQRRSSS